MLTLLHHNNKFSRSVKHVADQGRKALFSLRSKCKNMNLNFKTILHLFDTYIGSVLMYGCEIWGTNKCLDIEKIHIDFCKHLLSVRKSTCNAMVYFELGRLPLSCNFTFRILKFWFKLLNTDNCILNTAYVALKERADNQKHNWVSFVRDKLLNLGFGDGWFRQSASDSYILPLLKQRIQDQEKQNLFHILELSSKCSLYKNIVDNITLQYYLLKYIPKDLRILLTRLRLSAHSLNVETGRYNNIARNQRLCLNCDMHEIEDEFHFVLVCPKYSEIRKKRIKQYYYKRPSMWQLVELLTVNNITKIRS